jgi:double-stranded uracil-DNA glycosylase
MIVQGFEPIVDNDAVVIILGTLPGGKSLRLGQYYADGGNAFWFIVEKLFGIIASSSYDERQQGLVMNRIAIWVLSGAERDGSQDNKIVIGTEVSNDFAAFSQNHPSIRTVFFNGCPASGTSETS